MLCHCWNVTYTKLVHETTVFCLNCPLSSLVGLRGKANFWHHRRSSATSGRWVSLPLPPSVGQRGRPRVAGGERNTTPRQRKGGLRENTKWVSGKRKSPCRRTRGAEKEQSWLWRVFLSSLSLSEAPPLFWLSVRKNEDDDDDEDVEEESTMRHRFNKRDEHLDSSHSVAPGQTDGGTTPCKLRPAPFRPGRLDFAPEARGNFSHQKPRSRKQTPRRKSFSST